MSALRPWEGRGDAAKRWQRISWIILIIYRILKPFWGSGRSVAIIHRRLERRFKNDMPAYIAQRFRINADEPQSAFDRIDENYLPLGEQLFGSGFNYVQAVRETDRSFTHIKKCFFNDFFRQHGAPELTSIFCALDLVWIDELHQPKYQVRFERPTTLAKGDDACRFQFSRRQLDLEE